MKRMIRKAFFSTVPVMTGYLVLGFGFGILLKANGLKTILAPIMSLFIYAGSMQFVAVGLITEGASLITVALTTFLVNARHLFYGISMLDKFKSIGKRKLYLIFALTDETYSLLCNDFPDMTEKEKKSYYLFVSLFDHIYWVAGSLLGAIFGALVKFDSRGIDFVLTALFITIFLEQWLGTKKHIPAVIGVAASVLCLVIFGSESFLIPSMLLILLLLCLCKEEKQNG
ncbi:MAG: branched-chain amino acid transporter AzlC [Ruminococcaceae bacterium]|nr:branched-chain amino acid transporter AzlC [Oscillospiraceae bacterium]